MTRKPGGQAGVRRPHRATGRRRDAGEVLAKDLRRAVEQSGIKPTWLAEQAGLARQTVSGVMTGRIEVVYVETQRRLLEVLLAIDRGELVVPDRGRRPVGRSAVQAVVGQADACGWGHKYTAENTRIHKSGKRICIACEGKARKRYELRKARGLVGT